MERNFFLNGIFEQLLFGVYFSLVAPLSLGGEKSGAKRIHNSYIFKLMYTFETFIYTYWVWATWIYSIYLFWARETVRPNNEWVTAIFSFWNVNHMQIFASFTADAEEFQKKRFFPCRLIEKSEWEGDEEKKINTRIIRIIIGLTKETVFFSNLIDGRSLNVRKNMARILT